MIDIYIDKSNKNEINVVIESYTYVIDDHLIKLVLKHFKKINRNYNITYITTTNIL